jgi:3-carboxy-cis,cis-muconate cycloisomerase
MLKNLEATQGMIFAEAVTMVLGDRMGKMPAHMLVELACKRARLENRHLKDVIRGELHLQIHLTPADLERLFDVRNYLGSAEEFVRQVLAEVGSATTVN